MGNSFIYTLHIPLLLFVIYTHIYGKIKLKLNSYFCFCLHFLFTFNFRIAQRVSAYIKSVSLIVGLEPTSASCLNRALAVHPVAPYQILTLCTLLTMPMVGVEPTSDCLSEQPATITHIGILGASSHPNAFFLYLYIGNFACNLP